MGSELYPINEEAYRFELIEHTTELFSSDTISATYIIHLEGNGRLDHILEQIYKYKTSKKVFILYNKGYKKVKKQDYINKPPLDLVDAFLTIFKHASNNKFNNILIFEDDFICDDKLLDTDITNDICSFINSKSCETFVYHLGMLPFTMSHPYNNHVRNIHSIGTHAIIYSPQLIKKTLLRDQESIDDWDSYIWYINKEKKSRYAYKDCLCYQPFSDTENSSFWGTNLDFFGLLGFQLLHKSFKLINLDTKPKFGFNLFYLLCKKEDYNI